MFACANPALLKGEAIEGTFVHAGGRKERLRVRLDRLPGFGHLSPQAYRAFLWELADSVAAEHRPRRKKAGLPVPDPGRAACRSVHPTEGAQAQPAPVVHGPPEHVEGGTSTSRDPRRLQHLVASVPAWQARPDAADGAMAAVHAAARLRPQGAAGAGGGRLSG
ncbi:MAG: hypothetical protein R3F60_30455 [bacterium]